MDDAAVIATIEAQFLMGYHAGAEHRDDRAISHYSWDEDEVRQHLHVPLNDLWRQRVFELELAGLAEYVCDGPFIQDADGTRRERPGWQDEPREQWGYGWLTIHARGVLKLADLYGRPYVRCGESPVLLAHWELVRDEREAWIHVRLDKERWAREYPEQALYFEAESRQMYDKHRREEEEGSA